MELKLNILAKPVVISVEGASFAKHGNTWLTLGQEDSLSKCAKLIHFEWQELNGTKPQCYSNTAVVHFILEQLEWNKLATAVMFLIKFSFKFHHLCRH